MKEKKNHSEKNHCHYSFFTVRLKWYADNMEELKPENMFNREVLL